MRVKFEGALYDIPGGAYRSRSAVIRFGDTYLIVETWRSTDNLPEPWEFERRLSVPSGLRLYRAKQV